MPVRRERGAISHLYCPWRDALSAKSKACAAMSCKDVGSERHGVQERENKAFIF